MMEFSLAFGIFLVGAVVGVLIAWAFFCDGNHEPMESDGDWLR